MERLPGTVNRQEMDAVALAYRITIVLVKLNTAHNLGSVEFLLHKDIQKNLSKYRLRIRAVFLDKLQHRPRTDGGRIFCRIKDALRLRP